MQGTRWDMTFHMQSWLRSPGTRSTTACPADHIWHAEPHVHCQTLLEFVCSTASLNEENFENPYLRGRTIQVAIGKRGCQQFG